MLKLIENGKNKWYNIVDDCGCQVSGTKEELNGLYQQLVRIKGGLPNAPQNTERVHNILLENTCNCEKVQLRVSDSALRFLNFLLEYGWMDDDDIQYTTLEDSDYEFI